MLYCAAADGCAPVLHDFASTEAALTHSGGASVDAGACLVVRPQPAAAAPPPSPPPPPPANDAAACPPDVGFGSVNGAATSCAQILASAAASTGMSGASLCAAWLGAYTVGQRRSWWKVPSALGL
jgi:hypothetical protein